MIRTKRAISIHSRSVLVMSAGLYLFGTAILLLLNQTRPADGATTQAAHLQSAAIQSSATSLNTRSLGWPIEEQQVWPRTMPWVVMILMLIGASPAGTGGGLKTTTLAVLARGTYASACGSSAGRIFAIAIIWTACYLALIVLFTMWLASSEVQLAADQILFIATSAISNSGMSNGPISVTSDGMYTLSYAMMFGTILPLIVLWVTAITVRDADIAVG